ncbi:TatD family hydrolase [Leucobacter massiliensis]|uniref:Deoxyribonuclease n=1 Tax=Leucobacter massiliensis TaxID=1686285 RepID=A0A2S9QKK9_9MICO|nr:TatD family hydrolase [Leucobacter massiliensis]PRI10131.1 deoxyribonuclease [Leucobacter massiliensis]
MATPEAGPEGAAPRGPLAAAGPGTPAPPAPPAGGLRKRSSSGRERDLARPPLPEPLPVPLYDNHAHLEFEDGIEQLDPLDSLDRAQAAGVRGIVQVGTDLETSRWSAQLAESDPRVLAAVALHPNEAPKLFAQGCLSAQLSEISRLAALPRVRAVGETGLDFFRTGEDGREAQIESFETHIEIAKANGIALQIHDRDAHDEVVATLLRVGAPERTVFHCFSGDVRLARICNEHGWYMSFAGTTTFKNAPRLREALVVAKPELVLAETDAPFLTPEPYRGRPNAPYLLPHTVRRMAETLEEPLEEVCARIAANTERVYGTWEADPGAAGDAAAHASAEAA